MKVKFPIFRSTMQFVRLVLLILISNFLAAADSRKPFIAVLDFEVRGAVTKAEAKILEDALRNVLIKIDKFAVLDRLNMDKIFKEQKFILSGACDATTCQTEVGQLLGVEQIITGYIGKLGKTFHLTVQLTDVSTGQILKTAEETYKGEIDELIKLAQRTGYSIASLEPPAELTISKSVIPEVKKEGFGDLYIETDYKGSTIYLDDLIMEGTVPLLLKNISAGKHRIKALNGHYSASQEVEVEPNNLTKIKLILTRKQGILKIVSSPIDSKVFIDGIFKGATPLILSDILTGKYNIELFKEGFHSEKGTITIFPDQAAEFKFVLKKELSVDLRSNPAGAEIWVDSDKLGHTPVYTRLKEGSHSLLIKKEGFDDLNSSFVLEKESILNFDLRKSAAFLTVICEPSGAKIFLNGKFMAENRLEKLNTGTGTFNIRCEREKFIEESLLVELKKNENVEKHLFLKQRPACLRLLNLPDDSKVYLDSEPVNPKDGILENVKEGDHIITVRSYRYASESIPLTLETGEEKNLEFSNKEKEVFGQYRSKKRWRGLWRTTLWISGSIGGYYLYRGYRDRENWLANEAKLKKSGLPAAETKSLKEKITVKKSSSKNRFRKASISGGIAAVSLLFMIYNIFTTPDLEEEMVSISPYFEKDSLGLTIGINYTRLVNSAFSR